MTWFNAICRKDKESTVAEIDIIDQIGKDWWTGDGIAAKEFIAAIGALGPVDTIKLRMSTPGGNIADGIAIFNYLQRHPATIETIALSEVASIGSVIFLAGDKRTVCEGTTVMIHDPLAWAGGYVDLSTCEQLASTLRHYKNNIQSIYQNRTGLDAEVLEAMMIAETYMNSAEAIENGFATDKDETVAVNKRQSDYFDDIKERIALREPPQQTPRDEFRDIVNYCSENKIPELVPHLANIAQTLAEARTQVQTYQAITNACHIAGIKDQSLELFNLKDQPAKLIGHLIHTLEQKAEADIDPTLGSEPKSKSTNLFRDIYQARRNPPT